MRGVRVGLSQEAGPSHASDVPPPSKVFVIASNAAAAATTRDSDSDSDSGEGLTQVSVVNGEGVSAGASVGCESLRSTINVCKNRNDEISQEMNALNEERIRLTERVSLIQINDDRLMNENISNVNMLNMLVCC